MRSEPKARATRLSSEEALALWKEYKVSGDIRLRNELVLSFSQLVKHIVFRKVRELPSRCEFDDFVSCGIEAVISAFDRFDPERGASLEQFIWTRVQGAILDELRRQDWAPRSLRRWERQISRTTESFAASAGRRPNHAELANLLELSASELSRHQRDIAAVELGSLNTPLGSEDQATIERIDTLANENHETDPELMTIAHHAKERFRRAFDRLPAREREIAILLYAKELTLKEIGESLGVSESRVCQIHSQLKAKLRRQLSSDEQLFAAFA